MVKDEINREEWIFGGKLEEEKKTGIDELFEEAEITHYLEQEYVIPGL